MVRMAVLDEVQIPGLLVLLVLLGQLGLQGLLVPHHS
jgi:hypothetical protein